MKWKEKIEEACNKFMANTLDLPISIKLNQKTLQAIADEWNEWNSVHVSNVEKIEKTAGMLKFELDESMPDDQIKIIGARNTVETFVKFLSCKPCK